VQQHAQAAVSVELYTLPFYLTVLTSIKDTGGSIYATILSVAMEEMLHLQLAANLCLALGTTPNFTAPQYGTPIPFLDPDDPETAHYALINAVLGPLNEQSLQTMLDIETPDELQQKTKDHTSPCYPYHSIGELYDALLVGISEVGEGTFPWTVANQVSDTAGYFGVQTYPTVIASLADAKAAVMAINEQGEGKAMNPVPQQPFTQAQFPIDPGFLLAGEFLDPAPMNTFAHFGRFVAIQSQVNTAGWPDVWPAVSNPTDPTQATLQSRFATLITSLNTLWNMGTGDIFVMEDLVGDLTACWQAQAIPKWT